MSLHSILLKDFNDDEVCTSSAAGELFSEMRLLNGLQRYAAGFMSYILVFNVTKKRGRYLWDYPSVICHHSYRIRKFDIESSLKYEASVLGK